MKTKAFETESLQELIRDIQVGLSAFYAKSLEPYGVSISQFAVLLVLAQGRPRKMSEVAHVLRVSLPAITHLVDRLEERKLLRRMPHATDRRITLLDLTPRGLVVVEKTQGRTLKILTPAFLAHSGKERMAILNFMNALRLGIREAMEQLVRRRD